MQTCGGLQSKDRKISATEIFNFLKLAIGNKAFEVNIFVLINTLGIQNHIKHSIIQCLAKHWSKVLYAMKLTWTKLKLHFPLWQNIWCFTEYSMAVLSVVENDCTCNLVLTLVTPIYSGYSGSCTEMVDQILIHSYVMVDALGMYWIIYWG